MRCSSSDSISGTRLEAAAVIVAGGSGSRMGSAVPKQFMPLDGIPVLARTVGRFARSGLFRQTVIVLPQRQIGLWQEIQDQYLPTEDIMTVPGGDTRSESVWNGLQAIKGAQGLIVAIHDGVRPLVNTAFLQGCLDQARQYGNAIPCLQPEESFRYLLDEDGNNGGSKSIDRQKVRSIQTPQCFEFQQIKLAFTRQGDRTFTDEASLMEKAGFAVHLCQGIPQNIKITRPFDLDLAGFLLQKGF